MTALSTGFHLNSTTAYSVGGSLFLDLGIGFGLIGFGGGTPGGLEAISRSA